MFTVFVSFVLLKGIIYHDDNIVDFVVVNAWPMIVCCFFSNLLLVYCIVNMFTVVLFLLYILHWLAVH